MQVDPAVGARGNRPVQSDRQRNMQLVNGAVHGNLVSVPGDRDVLKWRTRYHAGIEEVADVADVRVYNALLHLKEECLRIVERWVDALPGALHLPLEPANIDAEVRALSQHEIVGIDPRGGRIVRSAGCLYSLAIFRSCRWRSRLASFHSGVPGDAGHKNQGSNGTAENQMESLHAGVGLRRGRRLAWRIFLRRRKDLGVTSTTSSSAMNSIACSRFIGLKGTRRMASSALEARMLVSFFSRTSFTSRSLSRECSPMTMPS